MATSNDLIQAIQAWERQHGHDVERVSRVFQRGGQLDPILPRLNRGEMEEAANLDLDLQQALRREEQTRRLAEAEQAELFLEEIVQRAAS